MSQIQSTERNLKALQTSLMSLQGEKLPQKVSTEIDNALSHLEVISQVLSTGEEARRSRQSRRR